MSFGVEDHDLEGGGVGGLLGMGGAAELELSFCLWDAVLRF